MEDFFKITYFIHKDFNKNRVFKTIVYKIIFTDYKNYVLNISICKIIFKD